MGFTKCFKLTKPLEYGDYVDIGNGYTITLDDGESPDDSDALIVRDDYDYVVQIEELQERQNAKGDHELEERNRIIQECSIRNIIKDLPELIEKNNENYGIKSPGE